MGSIGENLVSRDIVSLFTILKDDEIVRVGLQ